MSALHVTHAQMRAALVGQWRREPGNMASQPPADTVGMLYVAQQEAAEAERAKPIPMQLWCPLCQTRHVDEGEWATRAHHTHSCQNPKCGLTWRPAVVPTVGVYTLPGFLNAEPSK